MSESGSGLSGAGGLWLAAGASVVIVGGAAWYSLNRSADGAQTALVPTAAAPASQDTNPVDASASAPATTADTDAPSDVQTADPAAVQQQTQVAQEEPAQTAPPVPPAFDEVRREPDGMTIIAGRAAAGAVLRILQNGLEVSTLTVDASGKFAAFLMIPPDGTGHVLSLEQVDGTQVVASDDQIILAPLALAEAAPEDVEVAQAAPAPTPGPTIPAADDTAASTEGATADQSLQPAQVEIAQVEADQTENAQGADAKTEDAQADPTPIESATVETALAETALAETTLAETPLAETSQAETVETGPESPIRDPAQTTRQAALDVQQTVSKAPVATTQSPDAAQAPAPSGAAASPTTEQPAPAPAATASVVLKSTADGVQLLNTKAPEVMTRVALDTISYSDQGDVQLAGRAQAQTESVRVYLNNAPIASLVVDAQGRWRGDLPDVDEGIYTLRVDEVATDGTVTSRVETPFKREDPAVLVQAAAGQDGPLKRITVQKGNTLWAIARDRYGEGQLYVRVFQANAADIRDPDLIYPGQVFDLPD